MRCASLLAEFGPMVTVPSAIRPKISTLEQHTQTDETRKRLKFAGHIPLGAMFQTAEIDAKALVSPATWAEFEPQFAARAAKRQKQKQAERKREQQYAAQVARAQELALVRSPRPPLWGPGPACLHGHSSSSRAELCPGGS